MPQIHILIIEDEENIAQLVSYNLIKAGFHVTCAESGEDGLNQVRSSEIDCILLDLMLPGMSGREVCEVLKASEKFSGIPVIMLTAKGEEEDIVGGLECGADDYITKPFSPRVLVARLKSVLRRSKGPMPLDKTPEHEESILIHELQINIGRHEVLLNAVPLQLTMTEFSILVLLAGRPGWVFTRQQIIDHVRGYEFLVTPRAVDVQIFGLRRKLGKYGEYIETIRGVGYRFKE